MITKYVYHSVAEIPYRAAELISERYFSFGTLETEGSDLDTRIVYLYLLTLLTYLLTYLLTDLLHGAESFLRS